MAGLKLQLHVARNVEELNKMASELPKVLNAKAYLHTAENVFKKGEDLVSMGDEESAYIMYMRYVNIVMSIQKTSEYKKNEATLSQLVIHSHQKKAVDMIRYLRQSLKQRYEEKHSQEMDRHKKELDLENQKLQIRNARLASQESAESEPAAGGTVGFTMNVNPITGQEEYDVVTADE